MFSILPTAKKPLLLTPKVSSIQVLQPCVSVLMPFEPKMSSEQSLRQSIEKLEERVSKLLSFSYVKDVADVLTKNFVALLHRLDFDSFKKSVVMFVSPEAAQLTYLNIPLQETISVNNTLEVRDVILHEPKEKKYLILSFTSKEAHLYIGNGKNLSCLQILENRRLQQTIQFAREAFPYLFFAVAGKQQLSFLQQTCGSFFIEVERENEENTEQNLATIMQPYLQNWDAVLQKFYSSLLEEADKKGKLLKGITNILESAVYRKNGLLLIEHNYHPSFSVFKKCGEKEEEIYIHDAAAYVAEKLLKEGGKVEFVEEDALINYERIAFLY